MFDPKYRFFLRGLYGLFGVVVFIHTSFSQKSFEVVPVSNFQKVFVLREENSHRYTIFPNALTLKKSSWKKEYKTVIFWKRLQSSELFVLLAPNYGDPILRETEIELRKKDPQAEFIKPFMTSVVITIVSPWLDKARPLLPDKGQPLGDIPLGWHLDRETTLNLESFVNQELFLAGTISFRLDQSQLDFNQSFAVRIDEIHIIED